MIAALLSVAVAVGILLTVYGLLCLPLWVRDRRSEFGEVEARNRVNQILNDGSRR